MNWLLLVTPILGIALLLIGLAISYRLRPLTYVDDAPDSTDYQRLVEVTADSMAEGIVAAMRKHLARVAPSPEPAPPALPRSSEAGQFAVGGRKR